jgi:hypothetical protein
MLEDDSDASQSAEGTGEHGMIAFLLGIIVGAIIMFLVFAIIDPT